MAALGNSHTFFLNSRSISSDINLDVLTITVKYKPSAITVMKKHKISVLASCANKCIKVPCVLKLCFFTCTVTFLIKTDHQFDAHVVTMKVNSSWKGVPKHYEVCQLVNSVVTGSAENVA